MVLTRVSTVSPPASPPSGSVPRAPSPPPAAARSTPRPSAPRRPARAALLDELARGMVPQVAGDVDVGVGVQDGVEHEVPRTSAHRDPAHGPSRVAGDRTPPAVLGSLRRPARRSSPNVVGSMSPIRPEPLPAGRRCELDDVVRRLLVGVHGKQGGDDGRTPRARQHHLDPHLVDDLESPHLADRGVRPGERPEPSLPGRAERRGVVVADGAGARAASASLSRSASGDGTKTVSLSSGDGSRSTSGARVVRPRVVASASLTPSAAWSAFVWAVSSAHRRRAAPRGCGPSASYGRCRAPA